MKKTTIGFVGIILFLFSMTLGINLIKGGEKASLLDGEKTIYAAFGEDTPPACNWSVDTPERVMSENKTQAIVVQVTNPADEDCESAISLRASNFVLNPSREEQKIKLSTGGAGSLSWILTPIKTGTFEITVSDVTNTKIFGITVTNVFGLDFFQAKLLSIVGSLFGPMFTIPWWMDKWGQRKKSENE